MNRLGDTPQPLATVIVPVYNGATTIERCLNALAEQTMAPERYEIVVVNDGSVDNTAGVITAWAQAHPQIRCRLVDQKNQGPAAARNHGAQVAQSDLLLFTDADCAPRPDWIAVMGAAFADESVIGAKGAYLTQQQGLAPRFVQAEYEDRYDRMRDQPQIDFIDTYSAGYRREIFLANGGFDTTFTTASVEDQEFSFRLAQKGYRLIFVPEARVYHLHDDDLREYGRRKYYIGYWKALLARWHPERLVQDSHTPQVLKIQILLLGAMVGLLPLALLGMLWAPLQWAWLLIGGAFVTFVLSALPFLRKLARHSWALTCYGVPMLLVRALALGSGFVMGTVRFADYGATQQPDLRQPVIPGWKLAVKRAVDIVGALVGLLISIPVIGIAAIAIKLDSPGPVFYANTRIGEHGRPFRMVKLRSMVQDAEERLSELVDLNALPEPVYKLRYDPRITRVGRWLRRTSLDETPQFYHVLVGQMSLVGPRPEEAKVVALYQDHHRRRLAVKPGMTGPMQVSGRGNLSLAERLCLEIDYIDHYSLRRDVQIILRTFPAIFRGDGAY